MIECKLNLSNKYYLLNHFLYLLSKALNNADYYATRLQDYLIANSSNIPEFLESVGNATQIWPDQSNQYFGGLEL